MPTILIKGIRIYYEEKGEGVPLIFLNGLAQETRAWRAQVNYFSGRGFRVITYDIRGQGGSDKPEGPDDYGLTLHLSDLIGLFDGLGIEAAHLVGISHGGMIAQSFTLEAPERVRSLVLVDTAAHVGPLLKQIFIGWVRALELGDGPLYFDVSLPWVLSEGFIEANLPLIGTLRDQAKGLSVKPLVHLIRASRDFDVRARIGAIDKKTLILCGGEDRLTPPGCASFLHAKIASSKLIVFPGIGHCPPLESPDLFNQAVLAFLKE